MKECNHTHTHKYRLQRIVFDSSPENVPDIELYSNVDLLDVTLILEQSTVQKSD
jgi:hypothetical protein